MVDAPDFPELESLDGMSNAEIKRARQRLKERLWDYLDNHEAFENYIGAISRNEKRIPLDEVRDNFLYDPEPTVAGLYAYILKKVDDRPFVPFETFDKYDHHYE